MNLNNTLFPIHVPSVLYENRYCNQEGFSILVCGGRDRNGNMTNKVLEVKVPSFEVAEFPSMVKPHYSLHLANKNSDIFAIVDNTELHTNLENPITSVEIFSDKNKTWNHHYVKIEEHYYHCILSFMKQMFVIGELIESSDIS